MIQLQDSRKHLLQQDQHLWLDIPWPPSLSLDRALQEQDPSAWALLRCTPAKAPFPSTASTQGPQVLSHISAKALCSNSTLCMFAHEPPCHTVSSAWCHALLRAHGRQGTPFPMTPLRSCEEIPNPCLAQWKGSQLGLLCFLGCY